MQSYTDPYQTLLPLSRVYFYLSLHSCDSFSPSIRLSVSAFSILVGVGPRCLSVTIHPLTIFLHGLLIGPPFMEPLVESDVWYGAPPLHRYASDLQELKHCLVAVTRVDFRKDKQIARVIQGIGNHHRANPLGVVPIVVSVDGEHIDLAKQIGRDKFIYISQIRRRSLFVCFFSFAPVSSARE